MRKYLAILALLPLASYADTVYSSPRPNTLINQKSNETLLLEQQGNRTVIINQSNSQVVGTLVKQGNDTVYIDQNGQVKGVFIQQGNTVILQRR